MSTATVSGVKNITIAGIPNSGKTTIFNALTGSRQRVGNWTGVTVDKFEGTIHFKDGFANLVDLPGTYNLNPDTEDQRIAARAISSEEHDLIINVVDASNLSRNLYLTQDILRRNKNVVIFLSMSDVANQEGMVVDAQKLQNELGVPVCPVIGIDKKSVSNARDFLEEVLQGKHPQGKIIEFPENTQDIYLAIDKICSRVLVQKNTHSDSFTDRVDKIVLNKFLAVPIFLVSMFLVFWFAVNVGGAFIDFFDITAGLIFVDGTGALLNAIGAPGWFVAFIAGGLGAGLQTVATFIPVIFFIFLAISILQDSGYMSRLAVIADRFMRSIGLPGNAFIPMMVGFGCTVPAVMAARTLSTRRDRFMTIFMAPFMSCGARLPVYALFCAALFGPQSGLVVFGIYLLGITLSILTGLLLRKTLFKGKRSNFVMDLPFYHRPRFKVTLKSAFMQLKSFVFRAGSIIVIAVLILGFFNSMGYNKEDGITFGNEDSKQSVLSLAGRSLEPIFKPMGISKENWPASVALFTGLFAKEAIVGTVNSLYAGMSYEKQQEEGVPATSMDNANEMSATDVEASEQVTEAGEEEGIDILGTLTEAVVSIKDNFIDLFSSLDIIGIGLVEEDQETIAEDIGADTAVFYFIQKNFTPISAFSYMIFVLLYFPCLAVVGAAQKEMGLFYTSVFIGYLTLLGWALATLFYQVAEGHSLLYGGMAMGILLAIYFSFWGISRNKSLAFKE